MNFRDQFWVDRDFRKRFSVAYCHFCKTAAKLLQKLLQIEPQVPRPVRLQVSASTMIQLLRPADIAVPKMKQRNRRLNQPLIKLPRWPPVFRPQLLPRLMALEEIALIEMLDSFQIQLRIRRICAVRLHRIRPE